LSHPTYPGHDAALPAAVLRNEFEKSPTLRQHQEQSLS